MAKEELKPCPFCGGKAYVLTGDRNLNAMVVCESCGARTEKIEASVYYRAVGVVVDRWNARVEDE